MFLGTRTRTQIVNLMHVNAQFGRAGAFAGMNERRA